MRGEAGLTSYRAQVTVVQPGGGSLPPATAMVEPGEESLAIVPERGDIIDLRYSDIDDLFDDNYTLRLASAEGRRYDLSMLGRAYGQVVAEVSRHRLDQLRRDLLLTGVGASEAFSAATVGEGLPIRCEVRLFQDLLVVMPERGLMWGLPYSFIDRVEWDSQAYQVRIIDDQGAAHRFGWLAKRSEEFVGNLRSAVDALAIRTARTLGDLLPGTGTAALSRLSGLMRDGRAVQQRAVDAIDRGLWPRLEEAVVGTEELRASYDSLKARTPPGWAALGVKAIGAETKDQIPPVDFSEAGESARATSREGRAAFRARVDRERLGIVAGRPGGPEQDDGLTSANSRSPGSGAGSPAEPLPSSAGLPSQEGAQMSLESAPEPNEPKSWLWYFCPLSTGGRPVNVVAQEVTSEEGHATYLFRMMEPERFASLSGEPLADAVTAAIARLNRALLTLNFRREPIYISDAEITQGHHARYGVALRKLEYLRWTRAAFLGRAIHRDEAGWLAAVEDAISRA